MKWSWRIGRFAGIGVYIHTTFLLLLGWIGVSYLLQGYTLLAALSSIGFMLALFACIVLHEFGHALAAKRFGIKTRDITLLPIGGVARLERIPDNPVHELWVALAGPAVNVIIGGVLLVWLLLSRTLQPLNALSVTAGPFLERLLMVNVFLVGFNMIPAFPMDGGRVLRALLAMRLEYTRATQVAASIGQGLAFVLGFVGLFANPTLIATSSSSISPRGGWARSSSARRSGWRDSKRRSCSSNSCQSSPPSASSSTSSCGRPSFRPPWTTPISSTPSTSSPRGTTTSS